MQNAQQFLLTRPLLTLRWCVVLGADRSSARRRVAASWQAGISGRAIERARRLLLSLHAIVMPRDRYLDLEAAVGWRFRRSLRILPGVRVNISKRGFSSVSIGRRGLTMNVGRKGTKETIGLPGTGISYTTPTQHLP